MNYITVTKRKKKVETNFPKKQQNFPSNSWETLPLRRNYVKANGWMCVIFRCFSLYILWLCLFHNRISTPIIYERSLSYHIYIIFILLVCCCCDFDFSVSRIMYKQNNFFFEKFIADTFLRFFYIVFFMLFCDFMRAKSVSIDRLTHFLCSLFRG